MKPLAARLAGFAMMLIFLISCGGGQRSTSMIPGGPSLQGGSQQSPQYYINAMYAGWPDNSPPGATIAYPKDKGYPTIHNSAGGDGSYANPITFSASTAYFPAGTIIYIAYLEKYFIMEDECGSQCTNDWTSKGQRDAVMWVGGDSSTNTSAIENCESVLGRTSALAEVNPPSDLPVVSQPLFNSSTNTCYNPPGCSGYGYCGVPMPTPLPSSTPASSSTPAPTTTPTATCTPSSSGTPNPHPTQNASGGQCTS